MNTVPLRIGWGQRLKNVNDKATLERNFKAYHIVCADACIHFINNYVQGYDPRLQGDKIVPFELWPKQEEIVRFIFDRMNNDECGLIEKSRDTGCSYLVISIQVYLLLFKRASSLQVFSFKAESVHRLGDISTLMEKAIFILKHLPPLFIRGVKWSHMYIKNERMKSDIAGSSGNNPGRGSRRTMILMDESSFYDQPEMVEAALSETSNCRIEVSTHSGTSSLFYRKCQSNMPKIRITWRDDPRKSQKWFDDKRQDALEKGLLAVFAREVEVNAAAAVDNLAVPPNWVDAAKRCDIEITGKIICGFDPMNEGRDLHGFVAINGNVPICAMESGEGDPGDATDIFFWKAVELKAEEFRYDPIGVGAGVKVRIKEIMSNIEKDEEMDEEKKKIALDMKIIPWNASGKVMRPEEEDYEDKKNKDLFENAKAQAWWKVREEFRNTHRYISGKDHDSSQIIHFPKERDKPMEKLILEISQPQYKNSASGKTMIDKKPKGSQSPNLADAYVICRAEVEPTWISWTSL